LFFAFPQMRSRLMKPSLVSFLFLLVDRRALRKSQASDIGSSIVLREDKKDK
jgi:hypothetical protein